MFRHRLHTSRMQALRIRRGSYPPSPLDAPESEHRSGDEVESIVRETLHLRVERRGPRYGTLQTIKGHKALDYGCCRWSVVSSGSGGDLGTECRR